MFNLGPLEICAVLVLGLLVFGPKRLPEMGKAIGTAITEFKASMSGGSNNNAATKELPKEADNQNQNTPAG